MTAAPDLQALAALRARLEAARTATQPPATQAASQHTLGELIAHYRRDVLPTKATTTIIRQRSVLRWWNG